MDAECQGCRQRDQEISLLRAQVVALEAQIVVLRAEVASLGKKLDDRPPPPRGPSAFPPAPAKKATGKKPGAQPGHPPHLKKLLPPERVAETIPFVPKTCQHCHARLPKDAAANDPAPVRFQVADLPELAARIVEYQAHARTCPDCGQVTRETIPETIRKHAIGSGLAATLGYLVGNHGISKRGLEEITEDLFGVPLALGTIANLEQELSAALEPAHGEAIEAVRTADIKHVDETGWKQAGKKRWLWVAATSQVAVFLIDRLRNLVALRKLLGPLFKGILCSDRWCVYDEWPLSQRQLCWAHLKRNFEKLLECGGRAAEVARAALNVQREVFELWHLFRGGGLNRKALGAQMAPWIMEMAQVLEGGADSRSPKLKRFCARLRPLQAALWTFVVEEGVEPTNNHAERVQRRAVLWRRRSFGCQSEGGCRFVERILTVAQSLRLQGRSVVTFLRTTLAAHRAGNAGPKLVLEG
jgi:transposase